MGARPSLVLFFQRQSFRASACVSAWTKKHYTALMSDFVFYFLLFVNIMHPRNKKGTGLFFFSIAQLFFFYCGRISSHGSHIPVSGRSELDAVVGTDVSVWWKSHWMAVSLGLVVPLKVLVAAVGGEQRGRGRRSETLASLVVSQSRALATMLTDLSPCQCLWTAQGASERGATHRLSGFSTVLMFRLRLGHSTHQGARSSSPTVHHHHHHHHHHTLLSVYLT